MLATSSTPEIDDPMTTKLTTEISQRQVPTTQRLFYTKSAWDENSYGYIYDYLIDDTDGPQLKEKIEMPYAARLPSLTFNYDLKMFQIL